jgi:asparagine synthase (glutamine-hydrolysing)
MPGIIGIISKSSSDKNKQDISTMVGSMLHESFYSSGTYLNDQLGIYAGWVCHKDSFCDCLPIWNEKKDIALIFFGENFTDLELFDQLKAKHHRFDKTNAGYIVHMYEEKGLDFLQDLNGWFSGLLIDLRHHQIILFNDRYGMQKVFYHEGKDGFYFASEAKALLKVRPELREMDLRGLGELLSCACVLENRSLFKHVHLLPPASAWIFDNATGPDKSIYFDPRVWENQPWLEKEFFYERMKDTFRNILPRYVRAPHKIGISLTGGLDTRMLIAHLDLPEAKFPCYTFGGPYRDCYDVSIARKVAALTNQSHTTIPVDSVFLKNFSHYADKTIYITDGYLDVSGSTEVYTNNIAREIAPIRLVGNFGGELLRGLKHLKAAAVNPHMFNDEINASINKAHETANSIHTDAPLSFILFKDMPWVNNNRHVSEQSQLTVRTPYLDNDLVALMYRAPTGTYDTTAFCLRLIKDGNPALAKLVTDRGIGGNLIAPFSTLTHLLYEFLFKAEYAYNYGMPQWLARLDYTFKFMHFEKLFLGRHKFYHFRIWYRDDLSGYVKGMLLDDKTLNRPYLNRKTVEHIVESHTKGYRNYTTEITQLLTIELIQRLLVEDL